MLDYEAERSKRLHQRYDFLTELRDLMERHNAEFEAVVTPVSDGEWTAEVEVSVDHCSNICGSVRERMTIGSVCQLLNDVADEIGDSVR